MSEVNVGEAGEVGRIRGLLNWNSIGEFVLEAVFFGAPAFFLSRLLMGLTGGALWVPLEWRKLLFLLGILGGLPLFHLARIHVLRRFPPPLGPPSPTRPRRARRLARKVASDKRKARSFSLTRAIAWFVGVVFAILLHTSLRMNTVYFWNDASDEQVYQVCTNSTELAPQGSELSIDPNDVLLPLHLESGSRPWKLSVLFPLGFPWSQAGQSLEDELRYNYADGKDESVRAEALQHRPLDLIDILRDDERAALSATVCAFVLAHMLVMCLASIAYGYGFSLLEEVFINLEQMTESLG